METPGLPPPGKSARSNPAEIENKEREPWPSQSLYSCQPAIRAKSCVPDWTARRLNTRRHCSPGTKCCKGFTTSGVLELLRGLLGSGGKVLEIATEAAQAPESVRAIRNLVVLGKTLGEIDPDLFDGFAMAFPEAMRQAKAQGKEPPGFLAILNKFRSKDLRRGLVAVNSLLEAWGKDFFSEAHSQSEK